ncbi:hypothetical protein CHGG_04892 [Chaetomium globosum CBS 148.51]|uniref:Zn(2)-C6 fungal-type domain-containing protein n=1 Tax=Chaetomium globosum (strain ATCC 6205 / CBS 148.51 / DSM 1962 / NBRC 6347 / NRRL 1970) TaxID=306901 RepID=Q2H004_CHAGB|nr:uncharacterized protein CHGG_04892 [Chaetomium globosum CBS 148.51]EAQ88273.1 hypothetical protein CHGG_04892 [Chaetomium globosum CBS 148.51]
MSPHSSSNRSSLEPSSNPSSPSPSPAGTPPDPPRKRTRASKPKQPACLRCTSTGRTCDGYDKAALARYRSPDPNQTAERARAEFVRACEWNETLRSMRRIEADIDGTETEKRLFARFRAATADGVAAHLCNFAAFWRRLSPSTGCQDDAVKHAVIALAAAYQLFQYPDEPVIDGFARGDLEVFTIQQYSRSIERLQNHAGSSSPESLRLTLVCCLAFISLETLRGNHEIAVTHLTNGLRILQSLPDSTFDCLADGSMFCWPSSRDSLLMSDIVQLFARFELSACFFTHGIQPVISARGYLTRRFDDGSTYNLFHDVLHAHMAMSCFQHDVPCHDHQQPTTDGRQQHAFTSPAQTPRPTPSTPPHQPRPRPKPPTHNPTSSPRACAPTPATAPAHLCSPPPTPTLTSSDPSILVATHTPDPDTRAAAAALLADALHRGGLAEVGVVSIGGVGERGRSRARQLGVGVGLGLGLDLGMEAARRAQRTLSVVGRVVAGAREREAMVAVGGSGSGVGGVGGVGGGLLLTSSVEVPRALMGAGCLSRALGWIGCCCGFFVAGTARDGMV